MDFTVQIPTIRHLNRFSVPPASRGTLTLCLSNAHSVTSNFHISKSVPGANKSDIAAKLAKEVTGKFTRKSATTTTETYITWKTRYILLVKN